MGDLNYLGCGPGCAACPVAHQAGWLGWTAMTYLDHAATTPMLPEAVDAYLEATGTVGNASSLHAPGRQARRRVEEAREQVASALGGRPTRPATGWSPGRWNTTRYWMPCAGWSRTRGRRCPGCRSIRPAGCPRMRSPRCSTTTWRW